MIKCSIKRKMKMSTLTILKSPLKQNLKKKQSVSIIDYLSYKVLAIITTAKNDINIVHKRSFAHKSE